MPDDVEQEEGDTDPDHHVPGAKSFTNKYGGGRVDGDVLHHRVQGVGGGDPEELVGVPGLDEENPHHLREAALLLHLGAAQSKQLSQSLSRHLAREFEQGTRYHDMMT